MGKFYKKIILNLIIITQFQKKTIKNLIYIKSKKILNPPFHLDLKILVIFKIINKIYIMMKMKITHKILINKGKFKKKRYFRKWDF
jgi:hypothetical protein